MAFPSLIQPYQKTRINQPFQNRDIPEPLPRLNNSPPELDDFHDKISAGGPYFKFKMFMGRVFEREYQTEAIAYHKENGRQNKTERHGHAGTPSPHSCKFVGLRATVPKNVKFLLRMSLLEAHNFVFGQILNTNRIKPLDHGGKLLVGDFGPCTDNAPFVVFRPVDKLPGKAFLAVYLLFLHVCVSGKSLKFLMLRALHLNAVCPRFVFSAHGCSLFSPLPADAGNKTVNRPVEFHGCPVLM